MDRLVVGIMLFVLGLMGLIIKADLYKQKRQSYTGHQLIWGTYLLLIVGFLLMITSLFIK
jgi:Flp pilus assembly protein TadB